MLGFSCASSWLYLCLRALIGSSDIPRILWSAMSNDYDTEKSRFASGRSGPKPLSTESWLNLGPNLLALKVDLSGPHRLPRVSSQPEKLAPLVFLLWNAWDILAQVFNLRQLGTLINYRLDYKALKWVLLTWRFQFLFDRSANWWFRQMKLHDRCFSWKHF